MRLSHLILCLSITGLAACADGDDAPIETGTEATGDTAAEETGDTGMAAIVEAKAEVAFETLFQMDVGHRDPAGEHWVDSGHLVMISQTGDIWGNSDEGEVDHFRFGHLLYQDDITVEVAVADLESAEANAKAGVMIRRDARDPASPNVAVVYNQDKGVVMQWRDMVATVAIEAKGPVPPATPVYVRLTRTEIGNFLGEYSVDGEQWEEVGRVSLEGWGTQAYTGVVLSSGQLGAFAQGRFSELSIQGTALPMP